VDANSIPRYRRGQSRTCYQECGCHLLNILDDTTEYGKLSQIATACEEKEKNKEFVQVWHCERMCVSNEVIFARLVH